MGPCQLSKNVERFRVVSPLPILPSPSRSFYHQIGPSRNSFKEERAPCLSISPIYKIHSLKINPSGRRSRTNLNSTAAAERVFPLSFFFPIFELSLTLPLSSVNFSTRAFSICRPLTSCLTILAQRTGSLGTERTVLQIQRPLLPPSATK